MPPIRDRWAYCTACRRHHDAADPIDRCAWPTSGAGLTWFVRIALAVLVGICLAAIYLTRWTLG